MPNAPEPRRSARRTIIDIALRRQRPGSGSLRHGRTARVNWPDLSGVLQGLPWAVVGGVATRRYMPERATVDLDVLVHSDDADTARERLRDAGFAHETNSQIAGSAWKSAHGIPIDVIESAASWCREALPLAEKNRDEQGLPVLPLPFLVVLKIGSGRPQDSADILRMLGEAADDALEDVRAVVQRYAPDAADDVESLIALGRLASGRAGPEQPAAASP